MLKNDDVELPAAAGSFSGDLADPPQHSDLLDQTRRDPTTDITHHNSFAQLDSKHVCRVYPHIGASNNERLLQADSLEAKASVCPWKRPVLRTLGCVPALCRKRSW
jgi:hypothetical protein